MITDSFLENFLYPRLVGVFFDTPLNVRSVSLPTELLGKGTLLVRRVHRPGDLEPFAYDTLNSGYRLTSSNPSETLNLMSQTLTYLRNGVSNSPNKVRICWSRHQKLEETSFCVNVHIVFHRAREKVNKIKKLDGFNSGLLSSRRFNTRGILGYRRSASPFYGGKDI